MTSDSAIASNYISPQLASRPRRRFHLQDWLVLLGLIILLVVMLFPLMAVTMNSFKTEAEYHANGPFALPQSLNFDQIVDTWHRTDYGTKLVNSTFISLSTALLALGISLLNAFALGIGRVRGKTLILLFFLMAVTLPAESLAYPLYYGFKAIKLYDTPWAVILISAALHSAYGTYLLTSVFNTFPRELIEAAIIDGAGKRQLLTHVIVPLNLPTISLLFVFFFIWTWNDFFMPLIFLISNSKQTVPIALALAQSEHSIQITFESSAALLGVVPCIIFFLLFQRSLTRGITAGSLK